MSQEIIQMAKDVGSKKVIMVLCAPLIRYPNIYSIDMPSCAELIMHRHTTDKVTDTISVDLVIFQMLPDLITSVRQLNPSIEQFECSMFDGKYITGSVDMAYLNHLKGIQSDNTKTKVVNGLTSMQVAAVMAAVAVVVPVALGMSSTVGGSGSMGTPSTYWPADGVDATIGLHNTWKLS